MTYTSFLEPIWAVLKSGLSSNLFWGLLMFLSNLYLLCFFSYDFWFWLFGPLMGWFWGRIRVQMLFQGYLCSQPTFIFYDYFNSDFWFDFLFGSFLGGRPYWAIFWVVVRFKNFLGVYSCSWTTFIFNDSFNSDFWFQLNCGVTFYFLGP